MKFKKLENKKILKLENLTNFNSDRNLNPFLFKSNRNRNRNFKNLRLLYT